LARTGLIFTKSLKGTQPGQLTQTGQTKQGIQYHETSCCVLGGETGWGEVNLACMNLNQKFRVGKFLLLVCVLLSIVRSDSFT